MINYNLAFYFRLLFKLQLHLFFQMPIKMKTKIAVALVACFVIISACKKSGVFSGAKIATLNNYSPGAGYSASFTYNTTNGAVVTQIRNNVKYEYYYAGDTVTEAQVNALGQTTNATVYVLNGSGYADTAQGEFINQHNSYAYTYDANGMLTQVKTYSNHVLTNTDNYTNNSAKNLVEIQHISASNVITYDYYNYFTSNNNSVGVQNMGQYYLGISSVNLVETDVKINANADTTDIISWHYFYDGSGNVDTAVAYHTFHTTTGALVDSITYTYY